MKSFGIGAVVFLLAGVALADPKVTNLDGQSYYLSLDCKHLSSGLSVNTDATVKLRGYRAGSSCRVDVFPDTDDIYTKAGSLDPRKRLSSASLKETSECVIQKRKVTCG